MDYPYKNWRILLRISETLMRISPHYYRLNTFFANAALFNWGIDLYDTKDDVVGYVDELRKNYMLLSAKLESMNLRHEFDKIMRVLPYRDVFFGLIIENQNEFFIQSLNFNMCELYQIQDGVYNFKMNLSCIKANKINAYPDYVKKAYKDYIDGKTGNWYIPPASKQICIKFNFQWVYPYPYMLGLIRDIFDLDVFKKLKLQSARTDNYKAILVEVPIDKERTDKPLVSYEVLEAFSEMNRENMTDDIGIIHTIGAKGEAVSFKDSSNTTNNVADANDTIFDASGTTEELFNGSSSATAVTFSVENLSGYIYSIYRQFERWINRYVKQIKKYNSNKYKFKFYLLDSTIFNRDEVSRRYKDACSLGLNVVDKWLSSIGMTPSTILGSYILHKNVFDFENNLTLLSSTYNSTSSDTGRPTNRENGELLGDSGEQTADSDANADR